MLTPPLERVRTRRELARLSDHMRRDIGVADAETTVASVLILQPALLCQLRDPVPMVPQPMDDRRPAAALRPGLWINVLRGPAVRPI